MHRLSLAVGLLLTLAACGANGAPEPVAAEPDEVATTTASTTTSTSGLDLSHPGASGDLSTLTDAQRAFVADYADQLCSAVPSSCPAAIEAPFPLDVPGVGFGLLSQGYTACSFMATHGHDWFANKGADEPDWPEDDRIAATTLIADLSREHLCPDVRD